MVHYKKFDNGIRLVVKQMEGLLSVSMGIIVHTGASVENDKEDGISHFIEHMMFKGTKNRYGFFRFPTKWTELAHRQMRLRVKI